AGSLETFHHGRAVLRHPVAEHPACARRRDPTRLAQVLDGDGHSMKKPPPAACSNLALRFNRARARPLLEDREVGMQRRIETTNAIENVVRHFDWRDGAVVKTCGHVRE